MRLTRHWFAAFLSAASLSGAAMASPPPPPPEYVSLAQAVLTDAANKDQAKIAPFFANDVTATLNGKSIAVGKDAWIRWWADDRAHYYGRMLGYSTGWKDNGVMLVLDQFDTQDNSTTPPPPGDPRPSTRSTLYQFGADGLVHSIAISEVNSFMRGLGSYLGSWQSPRERSEGNKSR